jgi:sugar lactone lactonase YvrE
MPLSSTRSAARSANAEPSSSSAETGIPDGLAVDAEGCIWIALYLGWRLLRLDPNGTVLRDIRSPVLNPTSLCFGGPDLDVLYVTSAVRRHAASELIQQPWAGALMSLRPGVSGLPEALIG